jgi:cytochrome P450
MTSARIPGKQCPVSFNHESADHARRWVEEFDEIRSKCPLAWTESHGGYWVVTRYRDIVEMAQSPDRFSSKKTINPVTGESHGGASIPTVPGQIGIPDETDSPEWDGYRSFLNRRFAPKAVEERRARTERFAAHLIDRVIEKGHFDIIDDLTNPLPAIATMDIFGLPLGQWNDFAEPLHRLMYLPKEEPGFMEAAGRLQWMRERIEELVIERRKNPKDDLVTYLGTGEINGRKLDDETIWSMAFNLLLGGVDTTTALTSNVLIYLCRHPQKKQIFLDSKEAASIAREEFVRYFSPIHGIARTAAADVDFNGQKIEKGDRIYLAYAAANHDPEVFREPSTVKLDRFPNQHVGFGAGKHRCLGSFQARMMFETMIREVLTRMPDYQIDEKRIKPYPSVSVVNGWISIPATFTPGQKVGAPPL